MGETVDTQTGEIVPVEAKPVQLGSLDLATPEAVIDRAASIATALGRVIDERKLFKLIEDKKYVLVDGWAVLGGMLGIVPREVSCYALEDGAYEAIVELIRANDGMVIGRASAICGMDEVWGKRKAYARRSMAITRATGKAFRLGFSWIMNLAGYESTPSEEMDGVIEGHVVSTQPTQPPASEAPSRKNGKSNSTLAVRPWDAATLKSQVAIKVSKSGLQGGITDSQKQKAAIAFGGWFPDVANPHDLDNFRHTIQGYLFAKQSLLDFTKAEASVWIDYLESGKPEVASELNAVIAQDATDKGQTSLWDQLGNDEEDIIGPNEWPADPAADKR